MNPSLDRSEGFEDAALGDRAVAALPDERLQFPSQRGKAGQLALHIREMFTGDDVNRFTGLFLPVGHIEQCPYLLD